MEIAWNGAGFWNVTIGSTQVKLAPSSVVGMRLTLAKKAWSDGDFEQSKEFMQSAMDAHNEWLKDNPERIQQEVK